MNIFKRGQDRTKFQISFGFQRITNVYKNKITMFLRWKRGKKFSDTSVRIVTTNHTGHWSRQFPFNVKSTLFESSKKERTFKEKYLYVFVHEIGGKIKRKQGKVIGKLRIDLAELCHPDHPVDTSEKYSVLLWGKHEAFIHIKFHTEVLTIEMEKQMRRKSFGDFNIDLSKANFLSPESAEKRGNKRFIHVRSKSHNTPPTGFLADEVDIPKINTERKKRRSFGRSSKRYDIEVDRVKLLRQRSSRTRRRDGKSLTVGDEELDPLENVLKKLESSVATPRNRKINTPMGSTTRPRTTKKPTPESIEVQTGRQSIRMLGNASPVTRILHQEPAFLVSKKKKRPKQESDDDESESESEEEEEEEEEEEGEDDSNQLAIQKLAKENHQLRKKMETLKRRVDVYNENEKQVLTIEHLIEEIVSPLSSYVDTFPISAPLLFKSLRKLGGFQDKSLVFASAILNSIERQVLKSYANQELMLYWLSTTTTLLSIVQSELQCNDEDDEEQKSEEEKDDGENDHDIFETSLQDADQFRISVLQKVLKRNQDMSFFRFDNPLTEFVKKLKILIYSLYLSVLHNFSRRVTRNDIISAFFSLLLIEGDTNSTYYADKIQNESGRMLKRVYHQLIQFLRSLKDHNIFKPYVVMFMKQIFNNFDCVVFNTFLYSYDDDLEEDHENEEESSPKSGKKKNRKRPSKATKRNRKNRKRLDHAVITSSVLSLDIGIQIKMNISQFESLINANDYYSFSNVEKGEIIQMLGRSRDVCTIWMMSNKSILLDKSFVEEIQMKLECPQVVKILRVWNQIQDQPDPVPQTVIKKLIKKEKEAITRDVSKKQSLYVDENVVFRINFKDRNNFRENMAYIFGWKKITGSKQLRNSGLGFLED